MVGSRKQEADPYQAGKRCGDGVWTRGRDTVTEARDGL